jgi:AcrR family transcriptional regulator
MTSPSTKEKIMNTALKLFSERGYGNVSVRDIAEKVGIKAASLYNHFESKRDILLYIYKFFLEYQKNARPSLETLIHLTETETPEKVLTRLDYSLNYPRKVIDNMNRAFIIASQEICIDADSEQFARNYLFEPTFKLLVPLLNYMIKTGKIEPLDVEGFCSMLTHFAFSAAVLHGTSMKKNDEKWSNGLVMIFSLIKPVRRSAANMEA